MALKCPGPSTCLPGTSASQKKKFHPRHNRASGSVASAPYGEDDPPQPPPPRTEILLDLFYLCFRDRSFPQEKACPCKSQPLSTCWSNRIDEQMSIKTNTALAPTEVLSLQSHVAPFCLHPDLPQGPSKTAKPSVHSYALVFFIVLIASGSR